MRLASPLRSRQIRVSAISGFVAALVFCGLGTLASWRKPEDHRALIFYLLSLMATIVSAAAPLLYVDVFAAGGARSLVNSSANSSAGGRSTSEKGLFK
jgi:hypothetical protein